MLPRVSDQGASGPDTGLYKGSTWSALPKIYVATVVNSGRIPQVRKELNRVGIDNVEYNFQIPPPPELRTFENITLSCTDNHQQIYRKALRSGCPYVLIFEDDVYFTDNIQHINESIRKILAFANTPGWDFIYLGHFPWKIGEQMKKHPGIYRSISWCTHAYMISRSGMEKMLEHTPRQIMDLARVGVPAMANAMFKECGGIDTYIAYQTFRNKFNSYCIYPMLVYQYSIPGWKTKAKAAEYMSIRLGFWPSSIMYICWVMLWVVLVLVIWYIKKRERRSLA